MHSINHHNPDRSERLDAGEFRARVDRVLGQAEADVLEPLVVRTVDVEPVDREDVRPEDVRRRIAVNLIRNRSLYRLLTNRPKTLLRRS